MPLRLLFLNWRDANHPESGGAEKYLEVVAEGLAARGHDVTILTAGYPGALRNETVNGVKYARRGGHYSIYPWAMLSQLVGRHRGDVVIDVQNGVPYLSPLVRRGPVINLVHHVHREQWPVVFGPHVSRLGWWLESGVAPTVYGRTEYVAVSDSTARELVALGVDRDQITIIHNGTDAASDVGVSRASYPVVTVLGRLVPQKQVEVAMNAVAELAKDLPELELRIVGAGYWEPHLRQHATDLGIDDRTRFAGHVSESEKHRILAETWVHALPSLKEGWGLVVVEAGVHGTPTVAFAKAGGPMDSIRHGQTGILVTGGQAEFTATLREMLTDAKLRERLSRNVVTWVRRFNWNDSINQWEELLTRVARG